MAERLEPTLEGLRAHRVPDGYQDARLGIFVHCSVASVPGFAPREHDIQELRRLRWPDAPVHALALRGAGREDCP